MREDGVVGPLTWARALQLGLDAVPDDLPDADESGPNFPPRPGFSPLGEAGRQQAFGAFQYRAAGTESNPEAVQVLGDWRQKNIVLVEIPQLRGEPGTAGGDDFQFHRLVRAQVLGLFEAWEKAGLLGLVLSWGGSYAARFVRGSRTYLSNHAYGTAFDVNVAWNGLGVRPPLAGATGSVRKLVPLANRLGFYWGGHFKRPDGMHFEAARVLRDDEVRAVLEAL